jgi:hypothetical protein
MVCPLVWGVSGVVHNVEFSGFVGIMDKFHIDPANSQI